MDFKKSTKEEWLKFAKEHYDYTDQELEDWLKSYQHKYGTMTGAGFYEVKNDKTGEPFTVYGYIDTDENNKQYVYRAI